MCACVHSRPAIHESRNFFLLCGLHACKHAPTQTYANIHTNTYIDSKKANRTDHVRGRVQRVIYAEYFAFTQRAVGSLIPALVTLLEGDRRLARGIEALCVCMYVCNVCMYVCMHSRMYAGFFKDALVRRTQTVLHVCVCMCMYVSVGLHA